MSTLAERMAKANANNQAAVENGVDTSRPLLPEGEYMAKFSRIGGFKKDSALSWGRVSKQGDNFGKLFAQANVTWALDSKAATQLLNQENPLVFAENSIFLSLYDEGSEEGIGLNFFKSNQLVDLLGTCLSTGSEIGATKVGTTWNFEPWVLEAINNINATLAETFIFDHNLKETLKGKEEAVPEDIQVAMAQMTALSKLLDDWKVKANVFVVQASVVKDGKATEEKRNAVRSIKPFEQLDD